MNDEFKPLEQLYARALAEHGSTPKGLIWPNSRDLALRFEVMLAGVEFDRHDREHPLRLLDFGCGAGLLLDYLDSNGLLDRIDYTGVDVLEVTLAQARSRWPARRFELRDVRDHPFAPDSFDLVVACGVFTNRWDVPHEQFQARLMATLQALWPSVAGSLAVNTMSTHVDWQREDLFHWNLEEAMQLLKRQLSRHVTVHCDYGLWENTFVIHREPVPLRAVVPAAWPLP